MALKYHLVLRPDLRKGSSEGDKLLFPQIRVTERISYREICESISELSSASTGDVSCVLKGLIFVMKQNLLKGNIVQLGDLGNFRITAGSTGVISPEKFHTSLFKRAKIVYVPGGLMRDITTKLQFEQINVTKEVDLEPCPLGHD